MIAQSESVCTPNVASEVLVKLDSASVFFRDRAILANVSVAVGAGEIVTVVGPNGAGKTTLARALLGLQILHSGTRTVSPKLRIGYMPQKLHVTENMPLSVKRFLSLTARSTKTIRQSLERTGVAHAIESPVTALSGGELQRVLLARAMLSNPDLLVLDEPVQGVDIRGQRELYQLITELKLELGCSVLMVSHDLHLVMASTDRVICLNQHICCSGHPHLVRQHPAYLELFGEASAELAVYAHHHDHSHNRYIPIPGKNDV